MSVDYIVAKTDWLETSKGLNLNQFQASTNINKILDVFAEMSLEREQNLVSINESFLLAEATGEQLNMIAEEAGVVRTSLEEDVFRTSILLSSSTGFYSVVDNEMTSLIITLAGGDPEPELYSGTYKLVEIQLQESCVSKESVLFSINEVLPPVTDLLLLFKTGVAFGFEDDDTSIGFGTEGEEDLNEDGLAAVYV